MLKVWKKLWEPFGSCLLNSTGNPAHFHPSLARLAVLFSRQLPNSSHNFFQTFNISLKDDFIKNPQTTIALPFLTHNISAIGGVNPKTAVGNMRKIWNWKFWFLKKKFGSNTDTQYWTLVSVLDTLTNMRSYNIKTKFQLSTNISTSHNRAQYSCWHWYKICRRL